MRVKWEIELFLNPETRYPSGEIHTETRDWKKCFDVHSKLNQLLLAYTILWGKLILISVCFLASHHIPWYKYVGEDRRVAMKPSGNSFIIHDDRPIKLTSDWDIVILPFCIFTLVHSAFSLLDHRKKTPETHTALLFCTQRNDSSEMFWLHHENIQISHRTKQASRLIFMPTFHYQLIRKH